FYTWWRPFNLLIIGPSLVVNYVIARALLRLAADETKARARTAVLALGVVFNLGVLGYFKYANFAVVVAGDLTGRDFVIEQIILPLGISFITFQKIAFLVDVAGRRVERFTASDFMLFVLFFPQLIAGPIVHFRETMPQFHAARCKYDPDLFALGLTLFCFGLFKKVVLADGVAVHVTPIYELAAAGGVVTLIQAWLAAVGFTLQIYFDFSGYSDMACGAALFFGVRLPLNFDSPLKATNIIDFWLRWHVTLTRFLTAYVYNPVTLALTRRRSAKRLSLLRRRESSVRAFVVILAGPTLFTMFVSGVWHGAGYTFIVWGLLHGLFLVVNHA
ncbi:MAG: MBOAT family protein, partial [Gammaproteobacteria bacterium]|nr:MBOAT family protein [Gammaproteobacteria bacterium]